MEDLFFYCTLGVIIGGRIGYAAFYRPDLFTGFGGEGLVSWELIRLWDGGMSFHGGLLGVTLAMIWVSWRNNLQFFKGDGLHFCWGSNGKCYWDDLLISQMVNCGGELQMFLGEDFSRRWGYSCAHPSQLYQAGLEGLLMLVLMSLLFWKTGARLKKGITYRHLRNWHRICSIF